MNLAYFESIQYSHPQILENIFECKSHALVCAFNRLGTLLAIGCLDGNILIYDFIAKTFSKTIQVHSYPVHSIAWSEKSDILLSCSSDYSICLWSIINNQCLCRLTLFHAFPMNISFHPKNSNLILINFLQNYSILFNREKYSNNDHHFYDVLNDNSASSLTNGGWVSTFNHNGDYLLTGNNQGKLILFSTLSPLKIVQSKYIDQQHICPIKQICVSKESQYVAVLTLDKIRLYEWSKLVESVQRNTYECQRILFDHVMKMKYFKMNFSSDGEFICAASTRQHRLYIWEICSGSLVKILEDERGKTLSDIIWHPYRAMLISISDGNLYTWSRSDYKIFPSNFHQIDENILYHEYENEFDRTKSELSIDNDEQQKRLVDNEQLFNDDEEEMIDVISIEPIQILFASGNEYLSKEDVVWVPTDPISDEDEDMNE